MTATEKVEEVAKLRKYLDDAEAVLSKIGIFGRKPVFNKFDVIAMALVSKTFSVARAGLLLLDNGFEDEAYGMSRSAVECAWTLRHLTQTPSEIESRTWNYINYLILDKQFWMYHAMVSAKDEETKSHIRTRGEGLGLHDDPTEVVGHWSGKNGFGRIVNQMEHPLDVPILVRLSNPLNTQWIEQPYLALLIRAAILTNNTTYLLQKSVHVFLGRCNQELAVILA